MEMSNRIKKIKITIVLIRLVGTIVLISTASARAATWTQKSDMPTPRFGHSVAVVNDKIYVIGGTATETAFANGKPIAAVEEYDPATDTWTRKSDMPEPRGYIYGSHPVVDGKIYIIGGGKTAVSRVDVYDPATDTWSRAADMPTARMLYARVAWNGKIYTFGGMTGTLGSSSPTVNVTEVYDPQTDSWSQVTPMPTGVWEHSACVVNDKIYVIGGATNINSLQIFQVYDARTDTWSNATPKPLNTRGFSATAVCSKIYTVGGWLNSGQRPYAEMWIYDTATDTWVAGVSLPENRATATLSMVNGKIYAIGGTPRQHNVQATSTVYELEIGFPPPDFNGDGIIDGTDVSIMIDYWHMDNPLYDVAPAPCGDGIVDVQDLIFLSEHLFEKVNDPTLVAHWALDETEGMFGYDSAGDNDAIVVGGATWQPEGGQIDGALQLNGIDGYAVTSPIIDPADGPFSIFAWINGGAAGGVIISEPVGADWLSTDPLDGRLMTGLVSPPVGRFIAQPMKSEAIITNGQWHRIGFVWDGSYRHLYVDGIEVAMDATPLSSLENATNGLYLGAGSSLTSGTFFSGLIDDIRIYNRVVSP
jgi:N-acetylneuraminic acid mutarotase